MEDTQDSFEQPQAIKDDLELNNSLNPISSSSDGAVFNVEEIFYAAESTRLSFAIDDVIKEENVANETFDDKELEKAIKLSVDDETEKLNQEREAQENENALDLDWKSQDKHVFILSEAGKPIYTL